MFLWCWPQQVVDQTLKWTVTNFTVAHVCQFHNGKVCQIKYIYLRVIPNTVNERDWYNIVPRLSHSGRKIRPNKTLKSLPGLHRCRMCPVGIFAPEILMHSCVQTRNGIISYIRGVLYTVLVYFCQNSGQLWIWWVMYEQIKWTLFGMVPAWFQVSVLYIYINIYICMYIIYIYTNIYGSQLGRICCVCR